MWEYVDISKHVWMKIDLNMQKYMFPGGTAKIIGKMITENRVAPLSYL